MKLHPEMMRAADLFAKERDITLGQLIRNLLRDEISRHRSARPPVRADERLVAPLRACPANHLAEANCWQNLDRRLKAKGYLLRATGGGLALHSWPQDHRLCKASELGFSYARLMRRFHAPFPEHPHAWLAERMLTPHKKGAPEGTPDSDLIADI